MSSPGRGQRRTRTKINEIAGTRIKPRTDGAAMLRMKTDEDEATEEGIVYEALSAWLRLLPIKCGAAGGQGVVAQDVEAKAITRKRTILVAVSS